MATITERIAALNRLKTAAYQARLPWEDVWLSLCDNTYPIWGVYQALQGRKADIKQLGAKIIDETPIYAADVAAAGFTNGMTPKSRPWFRLSLEDSALAKQADVRIWLEQVEKQMYSMFSRSNFYGVISAFYLQQIVFGPGCLFEEEDDETSIRFFLLNVGEYACLSNSKGLVDRIFREFYLNPLAVVEMFGEKNVSELVKTAITNKSVEPVKICHAIYPRKGYNPKALGPKGMKFVSEYWEDSQTDKFLRESGYHELPVFVTRWSESGADPFCVGQGFKVLRACKTLHEVQKDYLYTNKMVNRPPMLVPAQYAHTVNMSPEGITWNTDAANPIKPLFQVNPDMAALSAERDNQREQVGRGFLNDLFMMISQMDKQGYTTVEIQRKFEEKLQVLGPAIEKQMSQGLNPIIDRTFAIGMRRGEFPPPPEALLDQEIKVEYISILAQAQKEAANVVIERGVSFVTQLGAIIPAVLDKVGWDTVVDDYFANAGLPQQQLLAASVVKKIREQRAEAQIQAAEKQQAAEALGAMQSLGNTKITPDTALGKFEKGGGA